MVVTRTLDGLRNLFSGIWGFFMRRRAERDRHYIEVISDPAERQHIHDAKLANYLGTGRLVEASRYRAAKRPRT